MLLFYNPSDNQVMGYYSGGTTSTVWEAQGYVRLEINPSDELTARVANYNEREIEDEGMRLLTVSAFSPEKMLGIAEKIGYPVKGNRFYPPEGMTDWRERLVGEIKGRERDALEDPNGGDDG